MRKTAKKILSICLVGLACTLMFTACNIGGNPQEPSNENSGTFENVNNESSGVEIGEEDNNASTSTDANSESTETESSSEDDKENNSVDLSKLWYAGKYSNGLLLVCDNENYEYFFINKEGERVFGIPQSDEKALLISSGVDGFLGKYCPIEEYDRYSTSSASTSLLLNESGEVIRPEDVGVSAFVLDTDVAKAMLADGYILAKRVEETYAQTLTELLVLDNEMNDLTSLAGILEEDDLKHSYPRYRYLPGFLYNDDRAIDLQTGKVYTDLTEMYSKISFEHESDWWERWDEGYYDIRDTERSPVLSLDIFPETRYEWFEFSDGLAGIMFRANGSDGGWNYYFSIINEKGELLFEPVKISGEASVDSCNGVYAVATLYNLYVFNQTGKIAEIQHQENFSIINMSVVFSEDIIVLDIGGVGSYGSIHIYSPDLTPLFD